MPAGRKSRTGCARCKEKRLKCDETRPACDRCTRSHESCPGYQRPLRWSAKHEIARFSLSHGSSTGHEQHTSSQDVVSGHSPDPSASIVGLSEAWVQTPLTAWSASRSGLRSDQLLTDYPQSSDLVPCFGLPFFGDNADQDLFENLEAQDSHTSTIWDHVTEISDGSYSETGGIVIPFDFEPQRRLASVPIDLHTFSTDRLQQRQLSSSIQPVIINTEYALIEYYFKEVAVIYSCFDGEMNPFRSTMARLWTNSANIAKTLQSMAAACLAPRYPYLANEGFKLRNEVLASISVMTSGDSICIALLVAIMLGQTAGWHDPRDLGLKFYRRSKELLQYLELHPAILEKSTISRDISFFQNAVGYWETLYAFVLPQEKSYPLAQLSKGIQPSLPLIELHPWTLANPELMSILRQVGQLVLTNRTMLHEKKFLHRSDLLSFTNAIQDSADIEQRLLDLDLPAESILIDPMDDTTPVSHVTTISQAYQLVALILIYRVFPDVLDTRMSSHEKHEIFQSNMAVHSVTDLDLGTDGVKNAWLRQLAMHALQLIKRIPVESHTRCIQPFLLIALSCEVGSLSTDSSMDSRVATIGARDFIQSRLQKFKYYLPPIPAQCRLDLVLEIWRRLDSGKDVAFWVDVVIEKEWQFLFG